ncbi:hypothetical protein M8J77_021566 [Diaphorina citri]|nr:hypothetical protein M8J77_021566 [Diaphorina citri]
MATTVLVSQQIWLQCQTLPYFKLACDTSTDKTSKGRSLLATSKRGSSLTGNERKRLVEIIITTITDINPRKQISSKDFSNLANQIASLFKGENSTVYYEPYKRKAGPKKKINAKGILYEKYQVKRKGLKRLGLIEFVKRTPADPAAAAATTTATTTSTVRELIPEQLFADGEGFLPYFYLKTNRKNKLSPYKLNDNDIETLLEEIPSDDDSIVSDDYDSDKDPAYSPTGTGNQQARREVLLFSSSDEDESTEPTVPPVLQQPQPSTSAIQQPQPSTSAIQQPAANSSLTSASPSVVWYDKPNTNFVVPDLVWQQVCGISDEIRYMENPSPYSLFCKSCFQSYHSA